MGWTDARIDAAHRVIWAPPGLCTGAANIAFALADGNMRQTGRDACKMRWTKPDVRLG